MIAFKSIEFSNFKCIQNGFINLAYRGAILINGFNGTGKSSIIDGLLWCLFGRTITVNRNCENKLLSIFSDKNNENWGFVSVVFQKEDVEFIIKRHINHPIIKNSVIVLRDKLDISSCTNKETNDKIEKIIGTTYDTFIFSSIFSLGNTQPFLLLTDKEKKEIILPNYFVNFFQRAYTKTNERINNLLSELNKNNESKIIETANLANKEKMLLDIEEKLKIWEKNSEEATKITIEETKQIETLSKQESNLISYIKSHTKKLNTLKLAVDKKNDNLAVLLIKEKVLKELRNNISIKLEKTKSSIVNYNAFLSRLLTQEKEFKRVYSNECYSCEFNPSDSLLKEILNSKIELLSNIETNNNNISPIEIDILKVSQDIIANEKELISRKNKISGKYIPIIERFKEKINKTSLEIKDIQTDLKLRAQKIKNLTAFLSTNNKEDKSKIQQRINNIKEKIESLNAEELNINRNTQIFNILKVSFSANGIESFMLSSVLNKLNQYATFYLNKFNNDILSITILPEDKLKNGDIKNKITVLVQHRFGRNEYGSCSAGEQRVIDVSLLFALRKVQEEIIGTKFNILFIDEIFDKLDVIVCRDVINFILTSSDTESLFVITHNENLALEFEDKNIINIKKINGTTTIQ